MTGRRRFRLQGLKGRWMKGSILIMCALVVVFVVIFSLGVYSYYYTAMRTGLEAKAQAASKFFTTYVSRTYAEYYQSAYRYTESFEDRDRLELQFINTRGVVEISSYGITAGVRPGTDDVTAALERKAIDCWVGSRTNTGEKVIAVSAPLLSSDGSVVGVMRYVSSTRLVDRQIFRMTALAAATGLVVIAMVIISNMYFIRTVTEPIVELTGIARRIADGSYGIQAEKQFDDEIGDLIDAVNDMSLRIGQAENTQTEFISSVSHELRTPLTAITGWSETLAYDEDIKGDSRRGITIISKEANRLTKMVEELLEFTRMQDGRFNLNLERLDVGAELEDAVFTYGELLRQEGVAVAYEPPEDALPDILGDPARLKQVFLNILDNAAKYGRSAGRVDVAMALAGGYIKITFRDFGPGIPESELPFVKNKFYKGSSKERGSGIGLAVCEEIVARHKGVLTIANAADGRTGTLVTVELPVYTEQEYKI